MEKEKNTGFTKSNTDILMRLNKIPKYIDLSSEIKVKPTTFYTFLRNPTSSSKVKTELCKYFNISVDDLENKDLSKVDDLSKYVVNKNAKYSGNNFYRSITSMSEYEINQILSKKNTDNEEINTIKETLASKCYIGYRNMIGQAEREYSNEEFDRAMNTIFTAVFSLDELDNISQSDLKLYIDIAEAISSDFYLEQLVNHFVKEEYFNRNLLVVLGDLLETKHSSLSLICFEALTTK